MNPRKPFSDGVQGVLYGSWNIQLLTPLVIRNGHKAAWQNQKGDQKKGRNQDIQFAWMDAKKKIDEGWSKVSDFNFYFLVNNDELKVDYHIPASSIRGSLRQWAIKSLIERADRDVFIVPSKEELPGLNVTEYIIRAVNNINDEKKRWADILSLFGCAYDLDPKISDPLTWTGRLRLNTSIFKTDKVTFDIQGKWNSSVVLDGPNNMNRHLTIRNPLDRVTSAAKDGGLHQFIEMSEGEGFRVEFHILNPLAIDLELIQLWVNDINDGFIRFGALSSLDRGRVEIHDQCYKLFLLPNSPMMQYLDTTKPDKTSGTAFEGIWQGCQLTFNELIDLHTKLTSDIKE